MTAIASPSIHNLLVASGSPPLAPPALNSSIPQPANPWDAPAGSAAEVDAAVQAAHAAFPAWRATPAADRVQFLFKLKYLLEEHLDELAALITTENGKTLSESKGELRRGIENVEVACGIPVLMQGYSLEDVAPGIDEIMVRQPLGVCAVITPFNFPLMIPLWFLPYAIATGNTVVLKPSDRVPFSAVRLVELIQETGLPGGVVNLVNGGKARRRRAARSSPRARGKLRRIDARGEARVHARLGQRQARAVPGRRQEPRRGAARCRPGNHHKNHCRLGVRLRRPALPRRQRHRHRRRSEELVSRFDRVGGAVL